MIHSVRDNRFFTCFGWARFTEAGYFGMVKKDPRSGECVLLTAR